MKARYYLYALAIVVLVCHAGHADIRDNLLSALNTKFSDASNVRLTEAQKIAILDRVGKDVGGDWVYSKLDTVFTAVNQELCTLNTDCAGGIKYAYLYRGNTRTWLQVEAGNQLFMRDKSAAGSRTTLYAFMVGEQILGFENVPARVDTIILEYYAYPAALDTNNTEWGFPDKYEKAALDIAAAECWRTVQTGTAQAKANEHEARGRQRIEQLKNPVSVSKVAGDTER